MTKEDELLSDLSLILVKIKACYSATTEEELILKQLFKAHNTLLRVHYGRVEE